jgi:hypothetical protein
MKTGEVSGFDQASILSPQTSLSLTAGLESGATAARQAWLISYMNTTDTTEDFINRNEVTNLVNTAS